MIGWFADLALGDRPTVGGKGASLGELTRAGIAVPPGFVLRTRAFEEFLAELEKSSTIRPKVGGLAPDDLDAIGVCSACVRARIEAAEMPAALRAALGAAWDKLTDGGRSPVAVRSSATLEDASDASFAGLQDTYLWLPDLEATLKRVRSCWASLYSVESISYRRQRGFPETGVAMAVVVQRMVDARAAGVMFTRSPTTGDSSVITIEGAWGLGSAVVGGEVTPDRWVVGKITGEITKRDISDKHLAHRPAPDGNGIADVPVPEPERREPCLSDAELMALRDIGRRVEKHYGCAQDIEWAIDRESRQILLLQSRPETVWSQKAAKPAAQAVDNPLAHVMSIFGGRR
jgi:phosphoenolpyruvate synthase/pyruvate phosphate dikinase